MRSGIVASDCRSIPAPGDGATTRITARRWLSPVAIGARLVACSCERIAYGLQDDLVGADTEELAELAHLRHLRRPPPALPEIDRLWLHAHPQCQLELGPALLLAERPDRLHSVPPITRWNYNMITSDV